MSSTPQCSLEERLTIHCLTHDQFGATAFEAPIVASVWRSGRSRPGDETSNVYAVGTMSSTSSMALKSRLTRAQSSTLTLSSGTAEGPGRSSRTRSTIPLGLAAELHVEDLELVRSSDAVGDRPNLFKQVDDHHFRATCPVRSGRSWALKLKKWALAHSGSSARLRINNYITGGGYAVGVCPLPEHSPPLGLSPSGSPALF